jgi:hypothetical protein
MSQEVDCYRPVTCYQTILRTFTDARYLIDKALTKALKHRKPVLLEVCRWASALCEVTFLACVFVLMWFILKCAYRRVRDYDRTSLYTLQRQREHSTCGMRFIGTPKLRKLKASSCFLVTKKSRTPKQQQCATKMRC